MLGSVPAQSQSQSSEPPSRAARYDAGGVGLGTIAMALAALTIAVFTYFAN